MRLQLVENHPDVPHGATDGVYLYLNSAWFNALEIDEGVGLLCHEVLHLAFCHHTRRGDREMEDWNRACDYAINLILVQSGIKLPKGALISNRFKNMSAEQIYDLIHKDKKGEDQGQEGQQQGQPQDQGQGQSQPQDWGRVLDAADENGKTGEAVAQEQEREWRVAAQQAAQGAKAQGKLDAGLEEAVHELLNPKVEWHVLLARYVTAAAKNRFDWGQPSRRLLSQKLFSPRRYNRELGTVVLALDISGSMNLKLLSQFLSEFNEILIQYPRADIKIIYCNTRVVKYFTGELPLDLKPAPRGGTRFQPAFDKIAEEGLNPTVMLYFTDLEADAPDEPPYPVIWVTDSKDAGPFGDTINI